MLAYDGGIQYEAKCLKRRKTENYYITCELKL